MPRNVTVTFEDGTSHVYQNAPDDLTPEQAQARAVKDFSKRVVHLDGGRPAAPQQPAVPEERGVTGYLGDLGAAFGAGAGQAVAFPGQLYRLATGETEAGPIEQLGKRATEYWEAKKSETQRAKERAVEGKVKAAEEAGAGVLGQAGVAFGEVITDPALLSTYIAQSLPQVVGGGIVGGAVKGGTKLAARKLAAEASKESVEQFAAKAGVSAAVATAALMQGTDVGADTFDEAVAILKKQGYSEEDAKVQAIELGRKAAANAALASLATQMLPGGRTIESALVRGGVGKGVISGAVKGALGEMPSEGLEEGSGAFFKNLALSEIDPTRKLSQDVGLQAGIGAAAGAGQGAIFGGVGGIGATAEPKVSPKAEEKAEEKTKAKPKGKRSAEEAAIDALDQETVGERAVEEANRKFEEAALEDQQQPPMGGAAALEGTEQRTTGGAGVGVSVPQPPTEAPAATGAGVGRLAPTEGLAGEAVSREGQPAGALTDEQINNLAGAGFTASQIENGVETVRYLRSERAEFADVLFIPVARDHAAGLTSEEIAKKNKIDTPLVSAIQVGLGLVPNEKAKPAAVETPAAETPAAETPAVEAPKLGTIEYYREEYRTAPKEVLIEAASDPFGFEPENSVQAAKEELARREKIPEAPAAETPTAETPAAETPAAETPAAETPAAETPAAETPASTALTTISKREPVEAPKGVLRSKYTFSDGSTYQIEKRGEEFHLVGVPDEDDSYLGNTRGEAERALNDDKNSGRLDRVVSKGKPGALLTQEQDSIDVDGETRPLLNSRGQRIHPTDEGVRNFWRGFGDSKVVDEEGRPLVMYTGTSKDKDFSSFNVPKNGAWFTADSKEASQYAVENDSMDLVYTEGKYRPVNTASRVIPAYLSIRNPYKMTKTDFDKINKEGYKRAQGQFFDMLRFRGYDGVDMGGGIWVVLKSPTQVKSAVGNTGAFSPTEKKILATQGQEPTVLGLHPTVSQALRAGDLNGMLKAIANTTSGFYADLARRLAELNLPTIISTGTARARQLTRASIDLVSAPQQNRLFSYVQLTYPDLYNKYFQNYDAEANLERVYDGLKELKKVLPEVNPVSAEFKDVLQAYNDNIESIDPRTLGFYSPDFDEVNVDTDRKTGTSNYVLLHETTHAATEMLITRYENEPETLTAEQRAAAKKLKELYKYTKDNYPGDPETYGLRNIYEFVAEAFTNRGFQTKLKDMTYDLVRPVSVWSRFVKSILDLFGINTVAANVMLEANKLFSADRPRARKSIGPMFAKKQKNGPVSGGWRTAYDHNTTLIKLFQDAIRGRVPLSTALNKAAPVIWNTSAYLARQAYLGLAPLRELAIATKSKFPQLTGAIKLVEQMVAYRGQKMKIAEDIVKDWSKLQFERFQQSALLGRIMLSATLQEQDPDTGNGSAALLQAWNALSPEAQSIYRRVRDFYANSVKEMIAEMKARARANMANDPAALKKALSDIDALFKGIKGPYFPLRRFGSFWFQVGTTDNDKEFYTFESMADRDFAMNERLEELQNGTKAEKALAETYKLGNSIGEIFDQNKDPTGVLGRVEDLIDSLTSTNPADVKKELKDSVHQLMYVLLPQQSMKKMFINRKGIQGASADMLRVFSDSAVHSAYQQARFKYSQDFLNNLTNAKDYIGEAQKAGLITPEQRAVYDEFIAEVGKRSGTILSTEDKRLSAKAAAAANQTTFFWMLTGPATAMLNVIGAAAFGIPDMGSKYGYTKTAALLTKNMAKYGASVPTRTIKPMLGKQFLAVDFPSMVEGGNLSPLQSMLAKAFIDAGDINISLTNALFEFGEQPSALYTGRTNTVKKFAAGLFHQAERFNREMVLMTSAELAYDKFLNEPIKDANGVIQRDASGKPLMRAKDATGFSQQAFDDALADAREVAGTALGDFSRAMKARAMQSAVGSVLFSMKSFALTASFFLMRNVDLSLNRPFRSDELADMRAALLAQKIAPDIVDQRIKEAQAELKSSYSEARRRMAGVMGITFLFGGLQAQPFFSLLLPALVAALKPDDDEEKDEFFNNENWFRNYMEINLGGYLGEMAMKLGMEEKTAKKVGREMGEAISGGIPAAAGVALTERVSIDPKDLWYRSGRFSPDYRETVMETIIANLGPAVGLGMNMVEAAQLMEEGRYQRAFERALPAIVSNPLKAVRLGKEGAVTKSGYTQVEEFTATELAMQALGFQPEVLARKQKAAMEATTVKLQIQDRRNGVLDRLYLERDSEKGYEYALQMVDEYNEKYPYYPIKPKDIAESFKRKAKAAAEAHGIGMVMPKKMRGRLEPMVEYAKDEDED